MNLISVLLLVAVMSAFFYTLLYIIRKNRRGSSCGSCNCCADSNCPLHK